MVKGKPGISNAQLMDEIKGNLRSIRRLRPAEEDNFALNETKLISNQLNSLFAMLTKAGWIIGSFSILVGGFGIANIMFVSAKERTTIIGIQKSLGAKNFFITHKTSNNALTSTHTHRQTDKNNSLSHKTHEGSSRNSSASNRQSQPRAVQMTST